MPSIVARIDLPTISLSKDRGEQNDPITVTFSGFSPGARVITQVYPSLGAWVSNMPLMFVGGAVNADPAGAGTIDIQVPFLGQSDGDFFFSASQLIDSVLVTSRSDPQRFHYAGPISELKRREIPGRIDIPELKEPPKLVTMVQEQQDLLADLAPAVAVVAVAGIIGLAILGSR